VVFPYDFRNALINTLIGILMALSLVVITGFVGQISVVQLALSGAAGFTVSHMFTNWGITFPLAAVAGIAVAVVIGIITAFSAVRVRGVSLAVVTLAGAVALENFGFQNATWGQNPAGSPLPELKWFGLDLGTNNPFRGIDGNKPSRPPGSSRPTWATPAPPPRRRPNRSPRAESRGSSLRVAVFQPVCFSVVGY
jgi:branched-chain amino acid transport system permease protein